MKSLIVSARARREIMEISEYIAQHNRPAAVRWLDRLDEAFVRLTWYPYPGASRDELAEGLRYVLVGPYLLLYTVIGDQIEILRCVHGKRKLDDLIEDA